MKKLYCVTTEITRGDCDTSFESLSAALDYIKSLPAITDIIDSDVEIAVIEFDDRGNDECVKVYSASDISEMM